MSRAVVDTLIERGEALVAALDGQNVARIEKATRELRDAVAAIADAPSWRADPELVTRLVQALRLAEAASGRLNHLADSNRRRLDRLAVLTGAPLPGAYARRHY